MIASGKLPDPGEVAVASFGLDLPAAEVRALHELLDDSERSRAAALRFEHLRRRFVVAHGRLRQLLGGVLGLPADRVVLSTGPHGKPAVDGVAFSLSHSGGHGLVAVTRDGQLGVDLEGTGIEPEASLLGQVLTAAERRAFAELPAAQRAAAFCRVWVRKEAVLKATGVGLSEPMTTFAVPPGDGRVALPGSGPDLWVQGVHAPRGYYAALAWSRRPDRLSFDDLDSAREWQRLADCW